MLNRNAEALFWVGRYIERAENHARLIDVHYHVQHDHDFTSEEYRWLRLVDALGARTDYLQQFETFTEKDVLSFITLDRGYANSLFSCVSQARNNLRTLREKLPDELWDILNSFYLWLGERHADDILEDSPHTFYRKIKEHAAMFQGVQQSVMLRDNTWHFIESGRYLERAENTVRILQSAILAISKDHEPPYPYLLAVLKSVSGFQIFRQIYADDVSVGHILEFLLTNERFPRSVYFAFELMIEHLTGTEMDESEMLISNEKMIRQASKLRAELACLEDDDLSLVAIDVLLDDVFKGCRKLGTAMTHTFFRLKEATA
ncbi:MAG: hypothetical protein A2189_04880 [Paenibacillus sp. RIFOXYA1_FULL_44_5]|nr:MAG: hypothetical protein A2189_04880 [Paenibacillus sp. RIFOXYA1_FULL_44_5]